MTEVKIALMKLIAARMAQLSHDLQNRRISRDQELDQRDEIRRLQSQLDKL